MRFLFLIHGDTEAEAALTPAERRAIVDEHIAYGAMLRARGAHVLGEALTGEAATVRPGEKPFVIDGPFAETKEGVGGFYVVDVREPRRGARARRARPAEPGCRRRGPCDRRALRDDGLSLRRPALRRPWSARECSKRSGCVRLKTARSSGVDST